VKGRRLALVAAFALLAVGIVLVMVVSWPDSNHRSAVEVVSNAGIPVDATPGPSP
jgi:hypothetical protein